MDDIFSENYIPNLQTSFKTTKRICDELIDIEIFDLEGYNENAQLVSHDIYRFGIDGYILCYSIENLHSFKLINLIDNQLNQLLGKDVPKILVANKSDLQNSRYINV